MIKQCSPVNYVIDVRGVQKVFHMDMLKRHYSRAENQAEETSTPASSDVIHAYAVFLIENIDEKANDGFSADIPYPVFKQTECWRDLHIDNDIQDCDRSQILCTLETYSDILTDIPGYTNATLLCLTTNLLQYLNTY